MTHYAGEGPLDRAWLEAGQQAGGRPGKISAADRKYLLTVPGYPLTEDMNGYQQEGVGRMDSTVHRGMRWSAASAYLRPALGRQVSSASRGEEAAV